MPNSATLRTLGGLLILLVSLAGCTQSTSRPRIQGRVTYQGNPVRGATLALYWDGGDREFFSQKVQLLADGTFSGEVPVPGNYKVVIEESQAAQEGARSPDRPPLHVPQKYRRPETTDYVWPIQSGNNKKEIVLVD